MEMSDYSIFDFIFVFFSLSYVILVFPGKLFRDKDQITEANRYSK